MSTGKDYAKIARQAEEAVASVKDAELRRIAFQKVLEDLLTDGSSAVIAQKSAAPKATKAKPKKSSQVGTKGGPQAYIEELVDESFFKKPKTISQVKAELENRGHHIPMTSLSGPMQKLCQRRTLRRQKSKGDDGNKQTFVYSNW